MYNNIAVFSLSASKELTKEICDELGIDVSECEVLHFSDGEILVEVGESVRGKNIYVIQSTCSPVSDNLMELLIMIDALKRASAKEITAVIPYFGYARQDRKAKPRHPITSKLVADLLTVAGVNRVVTMDLHAAQIQGFFNIPIDDMQAMTLIGQYIRHQHLDELVVVSPDHGGATRARKLAELLHCPMAIVDKRRPRPNVAEVKNIIGEVNDKNCILIDDCIDTGGTIVECAKALKANGAKKIYVACTHPIFSGPAIERLSDDSVEKIIVTNTIHLPKERRLPKMTILSVAPLLAKTIEHIEKAKPVSDVFSMFDFE